MNKHENITRKLNIVRQAVKKAAKGEGEINLESLDDFMGWLSVEIMDIPEQKGLQGVCMSQKTPEDDMFNLWVKNLIPAVLAGEYGKITRIMEYPPRIDGGKNRLVIEYGSSHPSHGIDRG